MDVKGEPLRRTDMPDCVSYDGFQSCGYEKLSDCHPRGELVAL